MKIYLPLLLALIISLTSCNSREEKQTSVDTLNVPAKLKNKKIMGLNLDEVPITKKEIGQFPYLSAPAGYKYGTEKTRTIENKYFFHNDSLVTEISGQYYHAQVFSQNNAFEDTYLIKEFKKTIEELGGLEIYSGGLPAAAWDLLDANTPAYATDMYDPRPYKYKQFLIRTEKENIWIELCHGLNANQIDFTVVREELNQN